MARELPEPDPTPADPRDSGLAGIGPHRTESSGRVLFVCTGNVCRSPLMERLLIALLAGHDRTGVESRVVVGSAGTAALVGAPMSDPTVDEVVRLGGDPAGFAARQLTAELVTDAGLVITATRTHRAAVATLVPRAARHTFTLLELARLLPLVDPSALPSGGSRIAGLAAAAAAKRGLPGRVAPGADDVPDPYLQQAAVYRRASDVMVPAVTALAAILG